MVNSGQRLATKCYDVVDSVFNSASIKITPTPALYMHVIQWTCAMHVACIEPESMAHMPIARQAG